MLSMVIFSVAVHSLHEKKPNTLFDFFCTTFFLGFLFFRFQNSKFISDKIKVKIAQGFTATHSAHNNTIWSVFIDFGNKR